MRRRCLAPRSTFGKSFPKSNPSLRFAARFDPHPNQRETWTSPVQEVAAAAGTSILITRTRGGGARRHRERELALHHHGLHRPGVAPLRPLPMVQSHKRPPFRKCKPCPGLAEGADRQCAAAVSCTAMINRVALRVGSLAMAVGSVCLGAGS
uniref:Uncharacterized protein n=1 Tax=Oryza glumipatula TaxID=40148 RepID=A0A0E0B2V3_9ORYZ